MKPAAIYESVVSKRRIKRFDAIKTLLMVSVVFFHALVTFCPGPPSLREAGLFVLLGPSMHIFMFLSGWFAKRNLNRGWLRFVWLFFVCNTTCNAMVSVSLKIPLDFTDVAPAMWYLFALIVFRAILSIGIRSSWLFILSIMASSFACFLPQDFAHKVIGRCFGFAPFFFLGNLVGNDSRMTPIREWLSDDQEHDSEHMWRRRHHLIYAGILVSIYVLGVLFALQKIRPGTLTIGLYNFTFGGGLPALIRRMVFGVLTVVMGVCFLKLIPSRPNLLTNIGARTLPVYLLHLWIILPVAGLVRHFDYLRHPWIVRYSVMLLSALTTMLLFHPFFSKFVTDLSLLPERLYACVFSRSKLDLQ